MDRLEEAGSLSCGVRKGRQSRLWLLLGSSRTLSLFPEENSRSGGQAHIVEVVLCRGWGAFLTENSRSRSEHLQTFPLQRIIWAAHQNLSMGFCGGGGAGTLSPASPLDEHPTSTEGPAVTSPGPRMGTRPSDSPLSHSSSFSWDALASSYGHSYRQAPPPWQSAFLERHLSACMAALCAQQRPEPPLDFSLHYSRHGRILTVSSAARWAAGALLAPSPSTLAGHAVPSWAPSGAALVPVGSRIHSVRVFITNSEL